MRSYCFQCKATLGNPELASCPECSSPRPMHGWPTDRYLGELVAGGQYRVVCRLGAGGFGTVYLVETVVGGLRRALKVLKPEWSSDEAMRERFLNEALVLEQINHPNVARCYAVGILEPENALYILLELVEGAPLSQLLRPEGSGGRNALSASRAVKIAKQVASGLAVSHARNVLHRDLKPENILIVSPGWAEEQVKLVDFGIAKIVDETARTTQGFVGTPQFMAPEQLLAGSEVDARSDLWQLGAVLFLMLTGELPYRSEGGSIHELLIQHEQHAEAGPAPSEVNPEMAAYPSLDRMVSSLLATDPGRRPRSAARVITELARIEQTLSPEASTTSLALLEALCSTPSEGAWWALCRYLLGAPAEDESLSSAAESLIADWPDRIRKAAAGWWEAEREGEHHRLWGLVRSLDLSGRGLTHDDLMELTPSPSLENVTYLSLAGNGLDDEAVAMLTSSRHLSALRYLDLSGNRISSRGARLLAEGPHLGRLEALKLAGNGLGPAGAEALARSQFCLRELDLSRNDIRASGAAALADSPVLAQLERLDLAGNHIGSDGAGALAVSKTLAALRVLDLSLNRIGPGGAAALALSPNLGRLRSLFLAQNSLGLQGAELLLASNRFSALESLDLSSNQLSAQAAMVLASSPFARRLTSLNLSDNQLGDAGLAALLSAHHLSRLRSLNMAQSGLSGAGVILLAGAPPELEQLDLSANPLEISGAQALAEALAKTHVRSLAVNGCRIEGQGLTAIIQACSGRITSLWAARNELGSRGASQIAAASGLSAVQGLDLSANRLQTEDLALLTSSIHIKGVRELQLDSNDFGDEDAESLVRSLESLPNLQRLRLQDNALGVRTALVLAASPMAARLTFLDLSHNKLGDPGVSALAQGMNWHLLHELDLEGNEIGLGAASALVSSRGMSLLSRINLQNNALAGLVDVHSLSKHKVDLLESSFALLSMNGADFAAGFYQELFTRHPGIKPLFAHTPMKRQQHHLLTMLTHIIENLRSPDSVSETLLELGRRHIGYGVAPSNYYSLGQVLVETIRNFSGQNWSQEIEEAWQDAVEAITAVMLRAHREEGVRPKSTEGAHELKADDSAAGPKDEVKPTLL